MAGAQLSIEVAANFARVQSDFTKIVATIDSAAKQIEKSLGVIPTVLKAFGAAAAVGLSLDTIKNKIESAIEASANLKIIAERTGATVEGLSGLVSIGKLTGTSADELATGLQKLAKSMTDAEGGGTKATAAFNAIGISTKQLIGQRPDEAFKLIATRLATYSDGAEKTAIAQILLGKSGANLLAVLQDQADLGDLVVRTTDKQATAALQLEKDLKRLEATQNGLFKTIANEITPTLDVFVKTLLDSANEAGGVRSAVSDLARDGSIREWAEKAVTAVGFVVDAFDGVKRIVQVTGVYIGGTVAAMQALFSQVGGGQFKAIASIREQVEADISKILDAQTFSDRLAQRLQSARDSADSGSDYGHEGRDRPKPRIKPPAAGDGTAADASRAAFAGQLKALEDRIAAEKKLFGDREQQVEFYAGLEYLTTREALEQKIALIQESLARELALYDQEAVAAKKRIADTAGDPKAQQEGRNALQAIADKRQAAEIEGGKQQLAASEAILSIGERLKLQTQQRLLDNAKANDQTRFEIGLIGQSSLAIAQANAARQVDLALETQLEQLRKQDKSADIAIATAAAEIQKADAIARVTKLYEAQRTAAAGARTAFAKYAEEAADTGTQVNNALTNAFKGAEDALVEFAKTGKLNFRSLVDSIISDLIRMQAKMLIVYATEKLVGLFGGSGLSVDTGGIGISNTGTSLPTAGGAAGGTNFVERDMLTILHKGEAVTPTAYNPSAGGHGGNINVHNYAGADVSASRDDAGNTEIIIREAVRRSQQAVAHDIGTGGGQVAGAMKSRGLNLSGSILRRA